MDKSTKAYLDAVASLQKLGKDIQSVTSVPHESKAAKDKRLQMMLKGDWKGFEAFCKWYYPHYIDADFGWFHKEAFKGYVKGDSNYYGIWEWARGHAKSVFLIMLSLYDKARNTVKPNTFRGLVIASATYDKAAELLGSMQMELQYNERYNADFGEQYTYGDWAEGNFATADGCGFWAFGLGQNPAGVRKSNKRPTHIFCDDADDKRRAENPINIERDMDWVEGELMGVCDAKYGKKFVYVNNRVHCQGLTAHLVGDVEETDKVRSDIHHVKVFLTEDPKTHKRLDIEAGGVPAWKERYTVENCKDLIKSMGANAERQLYHKHVKKGHTFKKDLIVFGKCPAVNKCDGAVSYADLSYKDSAKNDFKAVALLGLCEDVYYIIDIWLRQEPTHAACTAQFGMIKKCGDSARHYYEANFIQDMHTDTYNEVAKELSVDNIVREDKEKKDNKVARIASLEPLFSYGKIVFNEKLRHHPDMIRLVSQFVGFPFEAHDDGPDAVHGAISKLRTMRRSNTSVVMTGAYKRGGRR